MSISSAAMITEWTGPTREFAFPIEQGQVVAFARAIGEDPSSTFAPPTFAAATDHFDPEFDRRPPSGRGWQQGLPPSHLHVEQHFTYARPVRVGETLVARRGPGRRWDKHGRSGLLHFVEERTELRDAEGSLVVVMCWVDVHTATPHVALTNSQRQLTQQPPPSAADAADDRLAIRRYLVAEDLSRTQFVMYAGASGDFHPLHHDETMAVSNGYPSVFAPGMLTMAMTARAITATVDRASIRSFGGRFRAQVWPGDSLMVDVGMSDPSRVKCTTRKQDGSVVFDGYATVS